MLAKRPESPSQYVPVEEDKLKPSSSIFVPHILLSLLAGLCLLPFYLSESPDGIQRPSTFLFLSFVVLAYSAAQAWLVYKIEGDLFWLNPVIHTALIGNVMSFAIGNITLFLPETLQDSVGFQGLSYWTNYYAVLAIVASIGLWSGYWSPFSRTLGWTIRNSQFLKRYLRSEFAVRVPVVILLVIVSMLCRLTMISHGIYGYSSDLESLSRTAIFKQYLSIGGDLGVVALLAVSLQHFSQPVGRSNTPWLVWLILVYEIVCGLLTGFKSQVVVPLLVLVIAHYATRGRFPRWSLPAGLLLLGLAYAVIEPFRAVRNADPNFENTSLFYIAEAMSAPDQSFRNEDAEESWATAALVHFTSTRLEASMASLGLEYASEHDELPSNSPEFLRDIFLSPAFAVAPRILWPSKPESFHGAWYHTEVIGLAGNTSIGMSPITYLYFAGKGLAVFLGFFAFGIVQRGSLGLWGFGAGGVFVFLGLLSSLRMPDSIYYVFIISIIRYAPLLIFIQYFLFEPQKRSRFQD